MRYLTCIVLLFISTIVYGAEQKFFYTGEYFYTGVARHSHQHALGLFESGIGLGFKYLDDPFKITLDTTIGFSLDGARDQKHIGHKGSLDIAFEYIQHAYPSPVDWSPVLFTWNTFDRLALEHWAGYIGTGVNVTGYSTEIVTISFGVGVACQYAEYLKDIQYNTARRTEYELVYVAHGQVVYSPVKKLKLRWSLRYLPVYNFSEASIFSEIGIGVNLFRVDTVRKTGADFEMTVGIEHYTKQPTSMKKTDYLYGSSITFFF